MFYSIDLPVTTGKGRYIYELGTRSVMDVPQDDLYSEVSIYTVLTKGA